LTPIFVREEILIKKSFNQIRKNSHIFELKSQENPSKSQKISINLGNILGEHKIIVIRDWYLCGCHIVEVLMG
jgi:hypothetical protein